MWDSHVKGTAYLEGTKRTLLVRDTRVIAVRELKLPRLDHAVVGADDNFGDGVLPVERNKCRLALDLPPREACSAEGAGEAGRVPFYVSRDLSEGILASAGPLVWLRKPALYLGVIAE